MIYIVTHGEHSEYAISDVLEGPEPSAVDREAMRAAWIECGEKNWASVLVERFGFARVASSEMNINSAYLNTKTLRWDTQDPDDDDYLDVEEFVRHRRSPSDPWGPDVT